MAMKLSTGKIAFPIEFDNGDKETIYFNPNDPGLAIRMNECGSKITKRIEEIAETKKDTEFSDIEGIDEVQKAVCEEVNWAFGSDVSSKVFKHCSPFALIDGNFFILNFLDAVTPEITKQIEKSSAQFKANVEKHLSKYSK